MQRTFAVLLLLAAGNAAAADNRSRMEWKVDGLTREALVYAPASAKTSPCPVVFAFHGHGGTMRNAARKFGFHKLWPEAIVVYMQGLNTPGMLTDPEGKRPGWQKTFHDQGAESAGRSDRQGLAIGIDRLPSSGAGGPDADLPAAASERAPGDQREAVTHIFDVV